MSKFQEIERRKIKECARIADGYSAGLCISQGLIVGADGKSVSADLGAHGVLIPWAGSPHIKILVDSE